MNIKKHIPNFLTCCNLLCGCIGILEVLKGSLTTASYLIFLACIFDFFDGFAARILRVTSEIGKQLDSLADVVTFGVLPSFIVFQLINISYIYQADSSFISAQWGQLASYAHYPLSFIAFSIAVFSAIRLAKFNIDTRQSHSFIGLPTPANGILIAALPFIIPAEISDLNASSLTAIQAFILNPLFLIVFSIIMSYLLIAELPLLALKFKSFDWKSNKSRYLLICTSIVLLSILNFTAIPIIIFLYITLSFIENKLFVKS